MEKNFVSLAVAAMVALGGTSVAAPPSKVQITVEKKKDDETRAKAGGEGTRAKKSENVSYLLKLKNISFSDLAGLTVDYRLFVERQQLAAKRGSETVERVSGSKTVETLTRQAPQSVLTEEVTLNTSNLTGGYTYANGGRIKAEDSIVGVWVRVTQGGEVVGEYAVPPTVTTRGWGGN